MNEREEDVAHREAEHAVGVDRKEMPPLGDQPVDEPVERPHADLEQLPVAARE